MKTTEGCEAEQERVFSSLFWGLETLQGCSLGLFEEEESVSPLGLGTAGDTERFCNQVLVDVWPGHLFTEVLTCCDYDQGASSSEGEFVSSE